jgi:hypothetical protein
LTSYNDVLFSNYFLIYFISRTLNEIGRLDITYLQTQATLLKCAYAQAGLEPVIEVFGTSIKLHKLSPFIGDRVTGW